MEPPLIYMHVQHLQHHYVTEKTCCVETIPTFEKELRGQDKNSAKYFKCSSQIYEITEHVVYEKLVKVLKMDCSTCQELLSMDQWDSFKLHTSKCVISASTANETKLTDIFKINKQDQLTRDMEDVALNVLKSKIAHSNSPQIQFKNWWSSKSYKSYILSQLRNIA